MAQDPTEIRLKLRAAGYHPIPVSGHDTQAKYGPAAGKAPIIGGWQSLFDQTPEQIRAWETKYADHTNTGILARYHPGLDIDIMDERVVDAMYEFACGWFRDHPGKLLRRIGQPPKFLIPFRTDKPFTKVVRNLVGPKGQTAKIEFLGDGQQYVVHGIHPGTHKPYEWPDGALWDVEAQDLSPPVPL